MSNVEQTIGYHEASENRFPWGCLIGGCLTVLVLLLGGTLATGFAGYWFFKGQIAKYTSEEPKQLPSVEMSEEEIAAIEQRVNGFQEQLEKGEAPDQLVLTADEINALISRQEHLKGHVFVKIGDGQITADVSLPTDAIPGAKGRYFNGSVTAEAELREGVLIVTLSQAEVNGNPVPEDIMQAIRQENLAKDIYKDPKVARGMAKFESLVIDDDRIILTPKAVQPDDGSETTTEPDSQTE